MTQDSPRQLLVGGILAAAAYVCWGFLPLYFVALAPAGPFEVVGWRVVFSVLFCAVALTVMRAWRPLIAIVRQPRLLLLTGLAGVLILINWEGFLIGALSGHVVETSLGYFITPIVTVLLAVTVLHERLRVAQWIAIALAAAAVGVIIVAYGTVPWIALVLAASFGLYGLVKKRIGPSVDALSGLALETTWVLPIAIVQLLIVGATSGLTFGTAGAGHALLLAGAGVVTAVPLLFFAAGSRRIPLSVMGLVQFLAPVLQFITGVFILQEPMPAERWIGFAIVWVALIVMTIDSLIASRRGRHVVPEVADIA